MGRGGVGGSEAGLLTGERHLSKKLTRGSVPGSATVLRLVVAGLLVVGARVGLGRGTVTSRRGVGAGDVGTGTGTGGEVGAGVGAGAGQIGASGNGGVTVGMVARGMQRVSESRGYLGRAA